MGGWLGAAIIEDGVETISGGKPYLEDTNPLATLIAFIVVLSLLAAAIAVIAILAVRNRRLAAELRRDSHRVPPDLRKNAQGSRKGK